MIEKPVEKPGLRDVLEYIKTAPIHEWKRRTTIGKVLYPLWLIYAIAQWITTIFGLVPLYIGMKYLEVLQRPIVSKETIYKDGDSND